eukprot:gb/GECH01011248.1/.p1 GENE.gb/GECH01011248.1/~~gb/GECH01011248.1/.p1  ORF type:complete len:1008 (+),score=190.84 gb/GECH01011248.1/:1-3024(+)
MRTTIASVLAFLLIIGLAVVTSADVNVTHISQHDETQQIVQLLDGLKEQLDLSLASQRTLLQNKTDELSNTYDTVESDLDQVEKDIDRLQRKEQELIDKKAYIAQELNDLDEIAWEQFEGKREKIEKQIALIVRIRNLLTKKRHHCHLEFLENCLNNTKTNDVVILDPGVITLDSPIVLNTSVTLRGAGYSSDEDTKFINNGSGIFNVKDANLTLSNIIFEGIKDSHEDDNMVKVEFEEEQFGRVEVEDCRFLNGHNHVKAINAYNIIANNNEFINASSAVDAPATSGALALFTSNLVKNGDCGFYSYLRAMVEDNMVESGKIQVYGTDDVQGLYNTFSGSVFNAFGDKHFLLKNNTINHGEAGSYSSSQKSIINNKFVSTKSLVFYNVEDIMFKDNRIHGSKYGMTMTSSGEGQLKFPSNNFQDTEITINGGSPYQSNITFSSYAFRNSSLTINGGGYPRFTQGEFVKSTLTVNGGRDVSFDEFNLQGTNVTMNGPEDVTIINGGISQGEYIHNGGQEIQFENIGINEIELTVDGPKRFSMNKLSFLRSKAILNLEEIMPTPITESEVREARLVVNGFSVFDMSSNTLNDVDMMLSGNNVEFTQDQMNKVTIVTYPDSIQFEGNHGSDLDMEIHLNGNGTCARNLFDRVSLLVDGGKGIDMNNNDFKVVPKLLFKDNKNSVVRDNTLTQATMGTQDSESFFAHSNGFENCRFSFNKTRGMEFSKNFVSQDSTIYISESSDSIRIEDNNFKVSSEEPLYVYKTNSTIVNNLFVLNMTQEDNTAVNIHNATITNIESNTFKFAHTVLNVSASSPLRVSDNCFVDDRQFVSRTEKLDSVILSSNYWGHSDGPFPFGFGTYLAGDMYDEPDYDGLNWRENPIEENKGCTSTYRITLEEENYENYGNATFSWSCSDPQFTDICDQPVAIFLANIKGEMGHPVILSESEESSGRKENVPLPEFEESGDYHLCMVDPKVFNSNSFIIAVSDDVIRVEKEHTDSIEHRVEQMPH